MRLLLIASEFPPGPGGIGEHASQIARHLTANGTHVCAASPQDYAEEAEIDEFNARQPFKMVRLTSGRARLMTPAKRLAAVMRIVRRFDPDVILGSGKGAVWLSAFAALQSNRPFAAVAHGTDLSQRGPLSRYLTRYAYARAAAVICVSRFTADHLPNLGPRVPPVSVIHNGADASRFRILPEEESDEYRRSLGLGDARIVVTVGRVCERKGQDLVIRALPRILESVPNAHYVMAGLPEQRTAFSRLAQSLGVGEHVHFLGHIRGEDVVRLQNAAAVFVMASRAGEDGNVEGFGIAVVEAALSGVPSVVTRGSGLVEAIEDGESGMAVPPDDPSAIAVAVVTFLTDEERRRRFGHVAHRRARTTQTWAVCADAYDDVLRSVAFSEKPLCEPAL